MWWIVGYVLSVMISLPAYLVRDVVGIRLNNERWRMDDAPFYLFALVPAINLIIAAAGICSCVAIVLDVKFGSIENKVNNFIRGKK